jgi:hypothetical protein
MADPLPHLQSTRDRLSALCQQLSPEQAIQRPPSGGWTISEILEHLAIVERGQRLMILRALTQPPASPEALAETNGKLDFIWTRMASPMSPATAPDFTLPKGEHGVWPKPLDTFLNARQALMDLYESKRGEFDQRVLPHPIAGPFTLEQWFHFAAAHSQRHSIQIEGIITASAASALPHSAESPQTS